MSVNKATIIDICYNHNLSYVNERLSYIHTNTNDSVPNNYFIDSSNNYSNVYEQDSLSIELPAHTSIHVLQYILVKVSFIVLWLTRPCLYHKILQERLMYTLICALSTLATSWHKLSVSKWISSSSELSLSISSRCKLFLPVLHYTQSQALRSVSVISATFFTNWLHISRRNSNLFIVERFSGIPMIPPDLWSYLMKLLNKQVRPWFLITWFPCSNRQIKRFCSFSINP